MNTSGGGGVCDCGDVEAWKEGFACEVHQHGQDVDMEEVHEPHSCCIVIKYILSCPHLSVKGC